MNCSSVHDGISGVEAQSIRCSLAVRSTTVINNQKQLHSILAATSLLLANESSAVYCWCCLCLLSVRIAGSRVSARFCAVVRRVRAEARPHFRYHTARPRRHPAERVLELDNSREFVQTFTRYLDLRIHRDKLRRVRLCSSSMAFCLKKCGVAMASSRII